MLSFVQVDEIPTQMQVVLRDLHSLSALGVHYYGVFQLNVKTQ